jgi:acyl carrier protein
MDSAMESQITALVAATLHVDQTMVRRGTTLRGDLAADSLDCVALILAIEDEFGVDIHDEDAAEILTVGQMIEYVGFALAAKAPPLTSSTSHKVGLR